MWALFSKHSTLNSSVSGQRDCLGHVFYYCQEAYHFLVCVCSCMWHANVCRYLCMHVHVGTRNQPLMSFCRCYPLVYEGSFPLVCFCFASGSLIVLTLRVGWGFSHFYLPGVIRAFPLPLAFHVDSKYNWGPHDCKTDISLTIFTYTLSPLFLQELYCSQTQPRKMPMVSPNTFTR